MSQSTQFPSSDELFQPLASARTSGRVAAAIRQTILDGRLRPGESLPPERELADRFHVTRNTVREALRQLEQQRLVSIRHGSGIKVQDYTATAGLELAGFLLDSAGNLGAELMEDLAEARSVIGEAIILAAIDRFSSDSLGALQEAVDAFVAEAVQPNPTVRRLQELDFEIHNRLVRAGGNRVIALLHNSIREIYNRVAHLFAPLMDDPRQLVRIYTQILAALKAGEPGKAKRVFRAYFRAGREALVRFHHREKDT